MSNASRKTTYKLGEVCEVTDTQPYVLRFWESEFPQLRPKKARSGQPVYRRKDVDIILRIKQLLHDEEYSIGDARDKLAEELGEDGSAQFSLLEAIENEPASEKEPVSTDRAKADTREADAAEAATEAPEETAEADDEATAARSAGPRGLPSRQSGDWVERDRYNDAVQEIARLKREIADLESQGQAQAGELETLRRANAGLEERIDGTPDAGKVAELERTCESLRSRAQQVERLEETCEDLRRQVDQVETLEQTCLELRGRAEHAEASLTDMQDEITQARADRAAAADARERADAVANRLEGLLGELEMAGEEGSADKGSKASEDARSGDSAGSQSSLGL